LAERDEVVEAFEHDVLLAEMAAVSGILQPVLGHGLFWAFDLAGLMQRKTFTIPPRRRLARPLAALNGHSKNTIETQPGSMQLDQIARAASRLLSPDDPFDAPIRYEPDDGDQHVQRNREPRITIRRSAHSIRAGATPSPVGIDRRSRKFGRESST
jgi:hypothetical protein